jgi:hypothetical protein
LRVFARALDEVRDQVELEGLREALENPSLPSIKGEVIDVQA